MGGVTRLYIVRHAEAEGNIFRRAHGQYNGLLTENGLRQLGRLEEYFRDSPPDAVYSSDLYRAHRTALAVAASAGLAVQTDPRLREIALGAWEEMPWGEIRRRFAKEYGDFSDRLADFSLDGAETAEQVGDRTEAAAREIIARHSGGSAAIVSHGMAIRILTARLLGIGTREIETLSLAHMDNASVTVLRAEDGVVKCEKYGGAEHLGKLSTFAKQSWWRTGELNRDTEIWFRPADLSRDVDEVVRRHRDIWQTIYATARGFEPDKCEEIVREMARSHPRGVQFAMCGGKSVGLLLLSLPKSTPDAGHIALFSLDKDYRGKGLGIQLLGEAISFFRQCGRSALKLNVWHKNERALRFYHANGFVKTGESDGLFGTAYIMRRPITPDMALES
ncbi:MAG: GNAT family N-acetyltransferase [Oscillospiraceae bacterium]|nr:GNAT family N-acetyltransferase [Oscillospiraceae bacterium]